MEELLESLYSVYADRQAPEATVDSIYSSQLKKELVDGLDKQKLRLLDCYLGNLELSQEHERLRSFQQGLSLGIRLGTLAR